MIKEKKQVLRTKIAAAKRETTLNERELLSNLLFSKLECDPLFIAAHCVLLYYSLPDEVATHAFIEKWKCSKQILLPVVVGNDLELCCFTGTNNLKENGKYKIGEPMGEAFTNYNLIDLAIIPGVAFDNYGNRLGRGKGYYDRLLKELKCPTIGICYSFQLVDKVPTEAFDVPMTAIWTDKGKV